MKVPLLEYLDKLEATAKAAEVIDHVWKPSAMAEYGRMTQPKATLALIAKLREVVELTRIASVADDYLGRELEKLLEIEVPE